MTLTPPSIDPRNQQKLAEQVRKLAIQYCPEWKEVISIEADKQADALINIFSRMMEIVIQRLNRVPDRNFLTFLDMAGVRLLPPKIARVPLTFTMTKREKGEKQYGTIPAGTQIANENAVVFETQTELTVITPDISKAVSIVPDEDKWTDHSPVIIDTKKGSEEILFKGIDLIPHRLCIGYEKLFAFKEIKDIKLEIELKSKPEIKDPWKVKWYFYKEDSNEKIPLHAGKDETEYVNLLNSKNNITFRNVGGIARKTLTGFENETGKEKSWTNFWIFAELEEPIPAKELPQVKSIKIGSKIIPASNRGTGTIASDGVNINGNKTIFTKELKTDDSITAAGQTAIIKYIDSDSFLIVDPPFDPPLPAGTTFNYASSGYGSISIYEDSSSGKYYLRSDATDFTELGEGYAIHAAGQTRIVVERTSESEVTIDTPFDPEIHAGKKFTFSPAGKGTISSKGRIVTGTNKDFKLELKNDYAIHAAGQTRIVVKRTSESEVTIDTPFDPELPKGTPFTYSRAGTGTISSKDNIVAGKGTDFTNEFKEFYSITAAGQTRMITEIKSDELVVNSPFDPPIHSKKFTISEAGTGTIFNKGTTVKGITDFSELRIGDIIIAPGEAGLQTKIITNINKTLSGRELIVDSPFDSVLGPGTNFFYISPPPIDFAFFGNRELDISKDFRPFGDKPAFNDTFYIGSDEVFSKKDAQITITFVLKKILLPNEIKLTFEFWEGKKWAKFGVTDNDGVIIEQGIYKFKDSTNAFKQNGLVQFICPTILPGEINGKKSHWIRVRITDGNYGSEAEYKKETATYSGSGTISNDDGKTTTVSGNGTKFREELIVGDSINVTIGTVTHLRKVTEIVSNNELKILSPFYIKLETKTFTITRTIWVYSPATYDPPSIGIMALAYKILPKLECPETVLTYNDFVYQDHTAICKTGIKNFTPFLQISKKAPEFYLAFNSNIATLPVTIYFPILEKMFYSYPQTGSLPMENPYLAWEYWNGIEWTKLNVEDKTLNLTAKEMVQFRAPSDIESRKYFEFNTEYFWIRARLERGMFEDPPRLKALFTNTVWAYNLIKVKEEKLGSSNGKTDQVFGFSRKPVIDQEVFVKELSLAEEEIKAIEDEEGKDAVSDIADNSGNITGYWVRWHEMDHFYFSKPNSRHYIIDRNRGEIKFGDGVRGMIPLAGRDNIKCGYKSGGGIKGNVGARTITKLRTSFPYIASVTNPDASEGGAEEGNIKWARELGPQIIKHRDRAVTYEDFEWLAREASPKVVKVKCLSAVRSNPGWINLIIVPDSEEPKPLPTRELIYTVQTFLNQRSASDLISPSHIRINGPGYIRVGTVLKVQFVHEAEAKSVEGRIIDNLRNFFHPLRGGPEKEGWDFGRNVYISEVYEVIEKTEGVDHVDELYLKASVQLYSIKPEKSPSPYKPYSLVTSDGITSGILDLQSTGSNFTITGFKEGDSIRLRNIKDTRYLFNWDDVPENDLINLLKLEFDVDWLRTGKVTMERIDDNTIIISSKENSLSLKLDTKKTFVLLKIDNGTIREYIVKIQKDKSRVYEAKYADLLIKSISHNVLGDVLECEPQMSELPFPAGSQVETSNKRIRSYIYNEIAANSDIVYLKVATLEKGDAIRLHNEDDTLSTDAGKIEEIDCDNETIFIDKNYLVYSGDHTIYSGTDEINRGTGEELIFRYLYNTSSKEIHDLQNRNVNCKLDNISKDHRKFTHALETINDYDYCRYCFGAEMSKR